MTGQTIPPNPGKQGKSRYHHTLFEPGLICRPSSSKVCVWFQYLCEEAEDDYIVRVDEPETCVYVITVHSPRICRHPHLKSPTPTQPIPIVCVPLLTNQQYLQYQRHTEGRGLVGGGLIEGRCVCVCVYINS